MADTAIAGVIARHGPELMALPGVIGVAEGEADGAPCVVVFVSTYAEKPPGLPAMLEGYLVVVRRTAPFQARPP